MTTWPETVELPDEIGRWRMREADGTPCCALGHASVPFGVHTARGIPNEWHDAFISVASYVTGASIASVDAANDGWLSDSQRVLCYAAAWAYCGYTIHGFPEAARLAAAVKRKERKT